MDGGQLGLIDPLVLEVLRFGITILAGGLVAVITSAFAFDHAQLLQNAESAQRAAALRRALASEIDENLRRLDPANDRAPVSPTVRTAWEQARTIALDPAAVNMIAEAYILGETFSSHLAVRDAKSAAGTLTGGLALILAGAPDMPALNAYVAFRAALQALVGSGPNGFEAEPR